MKSFQIDENEVPDILKFQEKECLCIDEECSFRIEGKGIEYKKNNSCEVILSKGSELMICKNENFIDYFSTRDDVFEVSPKARGEELLRTIGKDVSFYFDNLIMSGIVLSIEEKEDMVNITAFTSKGVEVFDLSKEPVSKIVASNDNYFSNGYSETLRKFEVPSYKYRYTKKELSELKGKFVKVSYDYSHADGLVFDVFSNESTGILIEGKEGIKTIELFQIKSIDIISEDKDYYEIFKKNEVITSKIRSLKSPSFIKNNKQYYYPKNKIDSYLKDVINFKMGKDVDLSLYEKDWVVELHQKIDEYSFQALSFFREYNQDISEEERKLNLNSNIEISDYYKDVYNSLKEMVQIIENTDWTLFNRTQEEGVIDSLICIYENDMIFN